MITLGDNFVAKSGNQNYYCEKCDYSCSKKYNWNKHLLTAKHTNDYIFVAKSGKKWQSTYSCENCGKEYQHRQNLWRHHKNCVINNDSLTKDELILTLLKQNSELLKGQQDLIKGQQDAMIKLIENGSHNTTNTTYTNSNNNAFNLQFFLNETCKDAMNITDFVDSIKLQLSDLMSLGEIGYVEGISNIIVNNLTALDEKERPIHCTDKKRETMYIKDEGQWTKEDHSNTKLKKVINKVADKNIKLLPQFRDKYPDYKDSYSKTSDIYDKMVVEVMETCNTKKDKIIKNISKATLIQRK
jgi:hypothetical protein